MTPDDKTWGEWVAAWEIRTINPLVPAQPPLEQWLAGTGYNTLIKYPTATFGARSAK